MSSISMDKKDEIVMKLVHFLVTKENYTPIVVNGVRNEVWLENVEGPYKIIRINSNYIHNKEQFNFDIYKTNNVARQIKKKTLSWKMNVLNIFLDLNDDVKLDSIDHIDNIKVNDTQDLVHNQTVVEAFPNIEKDIINADNDVDLIVNVTNDINSKTAKENRKYEEVFKPKKIVVTYVLIALCTLVYILQILFPSLTTLGAVNGSLVRSGQVYRLVTGMFMHGSIWHLLCNMYSLYVIGCATENYFGKKKFLLIYFVSGIIGSMFSCIFNTSWSLGASGAIFGLMGALCYFGYYYRLYMGKALYSEIIPVIVLNLALSLIVSNIDFYAHIGGLIGGVFITIGLGIKNKTDKQSSINGWITFGILFIFTLYMLFFR
ncbi:MAG: rhomboid family intramembrane serine protease [Bacilli bacterium]|nr:rhomboid family intramembrane serine protease [Bacilli bacterium]